MYSRIVLLHIQQIPRSGLYVSFRSKSFTHPVPMLGRIQSGNSKDTVGIRGILPCFRGILIRSMAKAKVFKHLKHSPGDNFLFCVNLGDDNLAFIRRILDPDIDNRLSTGLSLSLGLGNDISGISVRVVCGVVMDAARGARLADPLFANGIDRLFTVHIGRQVTPGILPSRHPGKAVFGLFAASEDNGLSGQGRAVAKQLNRNRLSGGLILPVDVFPLFSDGDIGPFRLVLNVDNGRVVDVHIRNDIIARICGFYVFERNKSLCRDNRFACNVGLPGTLRIKRLVAFAGTLIQFKIVRSFSETSEIDSHLAFGIRNKQRRG